MKYLRIKMLRTGNLILFLVSVLILAGCSRLTLKPADFSWPIESVLKVDDNGFVKEDRYALSFDTKNMFLKETEDSSSYREKEIRLIRDMNGYFYVTSDNFKNVYVFKQGEGELKLEDKIEISENGISKPAFNQRQPYIELINGDTKILLTNEGIKEDDKDE